MWIFLSLLSGLAVLYFAIRFFQRSNSSDTSALDDVASAVDMQAEEGSICCGQHQICEKESLLAALSKEIEYYDDEELDRFKERAPDSYTESETEEFREVLYTMADEEVAGWCRSLQLRGISLPTTLKDDVLLIVGELRAKH